MVDADCGRGPAIARFLAAQGWAGAALSPLAGDASFRKYYRLHDGDRGAVLMDAPPPQEDVGSFAAIAEVLRGYGLSAPAILAADRAAGLLLIEDFGDGTYTRLLAAGADEMELYALAIDALAALHAAAARQRLPALPAYDADRLVAEARLLVEWYAPAVVPGGLAPAAGADYDALWRAVLPLTAVATPTIVLRDYHVDNLMLLPDRTGIGACGLLDFQDAVIGPPSYDLVSLLEDARRDVPETLRRAMLARYLAACPPADEAAFRRAGAILAAQRNCKIIGIFTRLWRRDGKPGYLAHIPRVWRLLAEDLREPVLAPLAGWFDRYLPPPVRIAPGSPPER